MYNNIIILTVIICSIALCNISLLPNEKIFAEMNQIKFVKTTSYDKNFESTNNNSLLKFSIHKVIDDLKKGDDKSAKSQLEIIQKQLQNNRDDSIVEEHIKSSLVASESKDNIGAIMHAQAAIVALK